MRRLINQWPMLIMLGLLLSFNSCKKGPTGTEDDSVSAADNNTVSSAVNATAQDASLAADNVSGLSRGVNGVGWALICGSADTATSAHSISITYDGSTYCGGVTRSGNVTISLDSGNHWSDTGAVINVAINNVVVTDWNSKAHFTVNGSITITNELGGTVYNLLTGGILERRHRGSLQVTWPNNTSRTWTFDRTFTWSQEHVGSPQQTVINIAWSTQAGGGIESSGTNRYGVDFQNTIDTTIQVNNYSCSGVARLQPWIGEYTHQVDHRTVTVQFGTDVHGNSQDNNADCATLTYGYYITYQNTKTGVNANLFLPYYGY